MHHSITEVFYAKTATLNYNHGALPQPVSGQGDTPICLTLKGESQGNISSLGGGKHP